MTSLRLGRGALMGHNNCYMTKNMAALVTYVVTSLMVLATGARANDWRDANKVLCWQSQRSNASIFDYWIQVRLILRTTTIGVQNYLIVLKDRSMDRGEN